MEGGREGEKGGREGGGENQRVHIGVHAPSVQMYNRSAFTVRVFDQAVGPVPGAWQRIPPRR